MTEKPTPDTPATMLAEMEAYEQASWSTDPDVDLAPEFADRIRAVGERELILYLFRTFADSKLYVWLDMLAFAWSQLSFDEWMRILEDLADERRYVYQFLMFASRSLAIDVRRLAVSHPNIRAELESEAFRHGGPRPHSQATRARLDDDFDYESVWRRLAEEGAPMWTLPSD